MRVSGWESLLARYLESAPPFRWGENDCALWAAAWVARCTGDDFTADWRGKYSTALGAKRRMTRLGFEGVADVASGHLSETPVPRAKRGDLVLHPSASLGICHGLKSFFLTESGLAAEDTLACPRAWAV